ncbi:hypothetical protein Pmar_PMAR006664 [Perkinsus marinus ATCC 50983]|uniref:Uncharacterized protein n=1 Tax=Perkinsus marinus (strain ATCC 50983 / TXsc) TaxID=423536 RepID=C5LLX0_PERM5|nr:hypothetical protein Pmar_PMAR006664 [Perkinsus marinus ATCC 50983]EER02342.1 hypothetical protein Pmar_PMAR006664 [Perkinsus marinus ATCC 50983]|eukprot:XP_002769624.1 hypothetical protein Pmar_PMAR006664 [Perkinsus marinus ATCC 50983]
MENIGFTVRLLDVPQQHDDNDNEEYDDHNNTLYNTDMAFDTKVDNNDYDGSRNNIMKYRNSAPIMMMMNPVIIARLGWDPLATTIVLYSHYDVIMISEGMEERGSTGFRDAIKWAINNNWIGPNEVSAVISTNSQWILEVRNPAQDRDNKAIHAAARAININNNKTVHKEEEEVEEEENDALEDISNRLKHARKLISLVDKHIKDEFYKVVQ